MIALNVRDYCENCPHFEPDVVKNTYFVDHRRTTQTIVYCANRSRCDELLRHLEETRKKT